MKRSEGERLRAAHAIKRLRGCIEGIEIALRDHGEPIGYDAGNAITQTALELAVILARLDAYTRAEEDQRGMIPIPTEEELRAGREALAHPMSVRVPPREPVTLPCPVCKQPRGSAACQRNHP